MAIITISRGSYSRGKDVAERVAEKLGYTCLAREVLLEASEHFDVPEIKLLQAIEDPPSVFERFTHSQENYISFIRAALLKHLLEDNLVYHGFAGHLFLQGVGHVVKVRILADVDERLEMVIKREKVTEREATHIIIKGDKGRRQWAQKLYGVDPEDPSLYDLVIHVGPRLTAATAADIICHVVELESFRTTEDSKLAMTDLALEAMVKAVLVEVEPSAEVTACRGDVNVQVPGGPRIRGGAYKDFDSTYKEDLRSRIRWATRNISEIKGLDIEFQ